MPTLLSKILRYLKKTERHIRTGKSDDILKQVMINVNPIIWFKSCNTNLLIISQWTNPGYTNLIVIKICTTKLGKLHTRDILL